MGMFLNSIVPFEAYKAVASDTYFVDKSKLLNELFPVLGKQNRYLCITRPRRFGKSIMAYMVGAFFEKNADGSSLFHRLRISSNKEYELYMNRHNTIFIDFSKIPENCSSYQNYISRISEGVKEDLLSAYPTIDLDKRQSLWDIFMCVF